METPISEWPDGGASDHVHGLVARVTHSPRLRLAVVSALGLFMELVFIRYLDAEVRLLAYLRNLPLVASFLGLGIGFALAKRRPSLLGWSAPLVSGVLVVAAILGMLPAAAGPVRPQSNLGVSVTTAAYEIGAFYLLMTGLFALVVVAMVPLGQLAGASMAGLPSLEAYTVNVLGALAGILAQVGLSVLSLPPWLGAAGGLAVLLACVWRDTRHRALAVAIIALTCLLMVRADVQERGWTQWSPYNKIEVVRAAWGGSTIRVQNLFYQRMVDLRDGALDRADVPPAVAGFLRQFAEVYNYPYAWTRARHVLVVGAGTGNDVAAALRHGVERVDAVEIDPRILDLGRTLHPERPYGDARVHVIVDDARAFFRRTGDAYDLIVFGLLDAQMSFFSAFSSSIRLDNYVYTVEGFRQALARLTPDGLLAVSFYVEQPWVGTRIAAMLGEAGGRPPLVARPLGDEYIYLAGPGVPAVTRPEVTVGIPSDLARAHPSGPLARDSWPFLYLADRTIPPAILWAAIGILALGTGLVSVFFRGQVRFDRHLFFLGAGFLLIETRSIAELGLLFGTTWRVSAVTIATVLVLILLANALVHRTGPLPRLPLYAGLGASLLASFGIPVGVGLGGGTALLLAMAAFSLLPVFFAALIFASTVSGLTDLAPALAANLVGSVLGGLLENLSMVVGIPALNLIALVVYAASLKR